MARGITIENVKDALAVGSNIIESAQNYKNIRFTLYSTKYLKKETPPGYRITKLPHLGTASKGV